MLSRDVHAEGGTCMLAEVANASGSLERWRRVANARKGRTTIGEGRIARAGESHTLEEGRMLGRVANARKESRMLGKGHKSWKGSQKLERVAHAGKGRTRWGELRMLGEGREYSGGRGHKWGDLGR